MLRAIIVDDEAPARDELKYLLSQENAVAVVGEADSGPAAITLAVEAKPDIIFLDVAMRGLNGLETAFILRSVAPASLVVFATAYDEYALRAFEVGAVDYLLKPFEAERVHAAVERLKKYRPEEWHQAVNRVDETLRRSKLVVQKLPVDKNGKITLIPYQDIAYALAQGGRVVVVTESGEYEYNGTLAEMQERLKDSTLMRVHKSYIVNLDKVKEVTPWFKGTFWLKVDGGVNAEIPVSKAQIKQLKDALGLK
ncbi:MAG: LytTR family DNA-binding domain-containing protein [Negativicutes bacterium]|nr:LytTR family DNA-binding domain-containing protein [Negativicutes bacterium]